MNIIGLYPTLYYRLLRWFTQNPCTSLVPETKLTIMPKQHLSDQFIKNLKPADKRTEYYDQHLIENHKLRRKGVKGLLLRVTKAGSKYFYYSYWHGGKSKRYKIGSYPNISLSDARDKAREVAAQVNAGVDPQAVKRKRKQQADPQTFKGVAEEFKDKYLPTLRQSTRTEYKRIIDKELVPAFGKYPIKEISRHQIISFLDKKAIKDNSPTMANRIRARLSTIYSFAIERGLAEANPVSAISKRSEGETRRERYYNEDEIKELWSFFEKQIQPTQSVLKMLLICGQRKGETSRMKWEDIRGDVWTIPAEDAKGKRPHDVPLSDMALEIIKKMKPRTGKGRYVFASPKKDDKPVEWLKRAVKNIKDDSEVKDFRPHDLRRTVATYMAKLGTDRTVLGKILNHKGLAGDGQVTAIYDRHSYMSQKRQAMNRWSGHLQKILSGKKAKITKIG